MFWFKFLSLLFVVWDFVVNHHHHQYMSIWELKISGFSFSLISSSSLSTSVIVYWTKIHYDEIHIVIQLNFSIVVIVVVFVAVCLILVNSNWIKFILIPLKKFHWIRSNLTLKKKRKKERIQAKILAVQSHSIFYIENNS